MFDHQGANASQMRDVNVQTPPGSAPYAPLLPCWSRDRAPDLGHRATERQSAEPHDLIRTGPGRKGRGLGHFTGRFLRLRHAVSVF